MRGHRRSSTTLCSRPASVIRRELPTGSRRARSGPPRPRPVADAEAALSTDPKQPLGEDGQDVMPLGKTLFAPMFGMVADRFGVLWMVIQDS